MELREVIQMRKRIITVFVMLFLIALMSGCCLIHNWKGATCTTPRTCSNCGETEGEASGHVWSEATCATPRTCNNCGETEGDVLGHALTEANYQEAAKCTVCGEKVGEPLQADFENYDIVYETQYDVPYEYTTHCAENRDYMVTGTVMFSNHRVFESDATHEAEEGYEWHAVDITFEFEDDYEDNRLDNYWWEWWCTNTDYYNIEGFRNSWTEDGYTTVNYNGIDYDKCTNDYEHIGGSYEFALSHTEYVFYVRVPEGYDGTVFAFYDWNVATAMESEEPYIHECANENTLYFRISGDAYDGPTLPAEEQESSNEEIEGESGYSNPDAVFIEEGVYYIEGLGYVDEEGRLIYYEDPNQYAKIEAGIGNEREDVPAPDEADDEFYKEVIISELQKYNNHIASHCGFPESEYPPAYYIGTTLFIDDIILYGEIGEFINYNGTGVSNDTLLAEVRFSIFNKTQYDAYANTRPGSYDDILKTWIEQGHFSIDTIDEIEIEWLYGSDCVYFDEISANMIATVVSEGQTYTVWMASVFMEENGEVDDYYFVLDAKLEE